MNERAWMNLNVPIRVNAGVRRSEKKYFSLSGYFFLHMIPATSPVIPSATITTTGTAPACVDVGVGVPVR